MVKHYTSFNIKKLHRGSIILIGNFDGLHLGHQKLFELAQSYKKKGIQDVSKDYEAIVNFIQSDLKW